MDYTSGVMPLYQVHKPPFSVEAPGFEKVPNETIPRRHPAYKDELRNIPAEGCHTVFDMISRSARVYPNHNAVGYRKLVKLHKETKKVQKNIDGEVREVDKEWQFFELTPFNFLTYKQYLERVLQLGSGLRKLGFTPEQKLHLFGTTRYVDACFGSCCVPCRTRLTKPTASAGSPCPTPARRNRFRSSLPTIPSARRVLLTRSSKPRLKLCMSIRICSRPPRKPFANRVSRPLL